ncbi:unnamed protein product, partial [Lepidochelys kempii]
TVLLWARDIHPETEKWETLESSLKTLLTLLRHCVNGGTLPHYFLRDFNLFNKRYGEGNGFSECLALQVLNKEEELFISLRLSQEVSERPGAFSRAGASLWEFKVSHWKALKELEEEELYKWEEEHLGDRSVYCPARWQQNKASRHFDAAIAELNQNERQSPQCQGKAEVAVRAWIRAPRSGMVRAAEQFAMVGVMSEDYPKFKNDRREKEDLTLDPDTAHPELEISEDGKEVKCGSFRNVSSSPSQFDTANCVVARQSFSSGRHYWEVFVGQKPRWSLGIVSERAERRGRLIQRKSW